MGRWLEHFHESAGLTTLLATFFPGMMHELEAAVGDEFEEYKDW